MRMFEIKLCITYSKLRVDLVFVHILSGVLDLIVVVLLDCLIRQVRLGRHCGCESSSACVGVFLRQSFLAQGNGAAEWS